MVGDLRTGRLAGLGPYQSVAAQPGVQRRGIVMLAVAPQHHVAARALRRRGGKGRAPRRYGDDGDEEQDDEWETPANHSSSTAPSRRPGEARDPPGPWRRART